MFSAPQPPAPKPPPIVKEKPAPPVYVPPINPFAEWSYNATVSMGDDKMALLENTRTKEGHWVQVGDKFLQLAEVGSITDQMVTLKTGAKPTLLAKSDTINVVPLDKSAAFMTGQGQPQQPVNQVQAATQALADALKAQMQPTARDRYRQWMQSPENAQRVQQRMDNQFNGRGGNGNGGNRGGRNRGGRGFGGGGGG
jgi:hypothetical protein